MPELMILIASTRPGRVGLPIAKWIEHTARQHGAFDVKLADLAVINLPFFDEPQHPVLGQYTKPHTLKWSALVKAADAFVFVMPEYNYGMSAPLKNALDFLSLEWRYKPVGFVSYGGQSGGTRAVQMVKQVVTALRMMPIADAVIIPSVQDYISEGALQPTAPMEQNARQMLDELTRWEKALHTLRVQEPGATH